MKAQTMPRRRTREPSFYSLAALLATGLLAVAFLAGPTLGGFSPLGGHAAFAGDDNDDDDDDDGGSSGGGGGSFTTPRSTFPLFRNERPRPVQRARPAPRRQAQPQRAVPRPVRAANEVIALALSDDNIATLESRGYVVLERDNVEALATSIVRLRVPQGTSLEAAQSEISAINADGVAAFNHYYRTSADGTEAVDEAQIAPAQCEGLGCAEKELIGWPVGGICGADARIGLIDTGINPDHETFKGGRLEVIEVRPPDTPRSGRRHGTAVAAILLGSAESRAPGLLPHATVIAVDAFYGGRNKDERSDAYTLVKAMNLLAVRDVTIMNLSFAGPGNEVLERMVQRLIENGVVLIAAAGNRGPRAAPTFPAAYPGVIAVTAVDRRKRVYRRAGRGDHIDIAAPGVEVWTAASIRGARTKTGTSFAAPFATAVVALIEESLGASGHDDVVAELSHRALDLGAPGKDPVYGHGLLQAQGLCAAQAGGARQTGNGVPAPPAAAAAVTTADPS